MSERVEVQYRDLLTPIKDPEKSFCVNISELLHSYITNFVQGKIPPNFNSAALLLQGSSSIYAKKVEYLHNLAYQLYQILVNNKKEESSKKETKERDRNSREKENKLNDPFFSIEIKPGKNLSCLRRKKIVTTKKGGKKTDGKKFMFVPVDLLPLEGEEKGDVFYDTRGDVVGNKNDFALNKCRVIHSGWLLLPTVSPESVPLLNAPPDYTESINNFSNDIACEDMDEGMPQSTPSDDEFPQCTPSDEGYPQSSGSPSSSPVSSQELPGSQPLTEDEGLGSLPCTPEEDPLQSDNDILFPSQGTDLESPTDGIENVPMEGIEGNTDMVVKPVRRSMRQALKLCQIHAEADTIVNAEYKKEKEAVKKAIQKKNTCNLPSKLKAGDENKHLTPASGYCARTFFSMDNKIFKGAILKCGVSAFGINSKLCKRLGEHYEFMNKRNRNKRKMAEILTPEDEDTVDVEAVDDIESAQDAAPDDSPDVAMETPLDDEDIIVTNDPILPPPSDDFEPPNPVELSELPPPAEDPEVDEDMLIESFSTASHHLITNALTGIDKNADISKKVYEWEQTIKPFLDELDQREAFDINLYGSVILNSFEDSDRKQTMTFKNFCKGKQKWEVHRYFMALLPLVNIGNVSIEAVTGNNGEEDILVTLLSRKMHHKELEEFGHNEGEH